jgi:RES domain-containing protein
VTVWRLERKKYAKDAFTGEGGRLYGNRFNSKGTRVVYAAESLPLALLEVLVGLTDYDQLHQYVFFRAELPDPHVGERAREELPVGWDTHPPTAASKRIGDAWVTAERSLALRVPSVIVPYSYNYLINPTHPAFEEANIYEAETLPVDERLVS